MSENLTNPQEKTHQDSETEPGEIPKKQNNANPTLKNDKNVAKQSKLKK